MTTKAITKVPFFMHDLGKAELDAVAKVLAGPILTTGEWVARFEHRFADYLGVRNAIAVTSCTGALHLSLLALGIKPGDEVITTPMTFIATATAIMEAGARPVFVDVEPDTGNLDASLVEAAITERTRAIVPVHLYGQMCDMRALRKIADSYNLALIEDAAHCVEGTRDGVKTGELGDTACYSFYATKNLTCGEGGALVTNDDELAEKLRLLRLHGMNKNANDRHREGYKHWDMTVLGWKYNMDNIQAALLLPQMDRLEDNWRKRQALAKEYESRLWDIPNLSRPKTLIGVEHSWHLFPVWIGGGLRDHVINELQSEGISVMVNYRAIHLLTFFRETFNFEPGAFPVAERIGDASLSLPFYPNMPIEHVDLVTGALARILEQAR
ncbi:MAG: UDP-4-amino-4,6-dideoxy-N-acetyl-beta-L-altrosamine transaminase [Acidobacteria bacterium]|nr:MAG: UDP-4-amino-4,6-dideoxy-N-acetyl-beta-L-altrosamine transaminase [Acidobacteriota bacterium]